MEKRLYVEVRPYQHKELVKLYNTSKASLNKDLKPLREQLGKRVGNRWSIRQVEIIFEALGRPYSVISEE